MDFNKFKKILDRYNDGSANETEKAMVDAWYRSYRNNEVSPDMEEAGNLRNRMLENINTATRRRRVISMPLLRIAAGITLFVTAAFFGWRLTRATKDEPIAYTTFTTKVNDMKELQLPDGTAIWLNAAGKLKVPETFNGKQREVILEEGEAFFEVKHDPTHPFIVHTSPINVQVLGTSFNIKAYKGLSNISVTVATGKVGVTGGAKTLAMLTPGQQLSYDIKTGTTSQKEVNTEHIQSWKKGTTYLDQASFKELALTVKNLYGFNIKAGSTKVSNYHFSLRLLHSLNKQQVIALISQLHHTHYRKEGNDIVLY